MSAVVMPELDYPDDNGEPMSDNTLQFEWIVTLKGGLEAMFRDDPNVFVAGDLLWYPVEGQPKVRAAPDAMVAISRPKGYRGSYKQWEEGGVAPQVVFEVLSPGNRPAEMKLKHAFYEAHGVEEYYVYDPDRVTLAGYLRDRTGQFGEVPVMDGHVSPRLGIRFDLADELIVSSPGSGRFLTHLESVRQYESERAKLEALRAKLRAAGIDPDAV